MYLSKCYAAETWCDIPVFIGQLWRGRRKPPVKTYIVAIRKKRVAKKREGRKGREEDLIVSF